jgi:transporter family protein
MAVRRTLRIGVAALVVMLAAEGRVVMSGWFGYALGAALLYGLHQIFTKLAAERISDGLGSLVVEGTAVLTVAFYLAVLYLSGRWTQSSSGIGLFYAALTGVCVGAGTILFFLLFQKGGPLSAVPAILAGGSAVMAVAGIVAFGEPASPLRLLGVVLALAGLYLVR